MAHIDYFFAPISPNTYLAGTRLEVIAEKHGATIAYRPVDIPGLFARTGGVMPKDRHPSRQEYRAQELHRQAAKQGLALNIKPMFWPTNGAPSAYAVITAAKEGGGDLGLLIHALGRSCWADEKNIAEDDVIRACLTEAGFDPGIADRGLFEAAGVYEANLEEAVARGAFGLPFYIVADSDERFWGQDRLDDLDAYLSGNF